MLALNETWMQTAPAVIQICKKYGVKASLEELLSVKNIITAAS